MKHHVIRHKLSEFIDGSITPGEKAEIEEHLQTCTVCIDALRELKKTVEYIKAVDEVEPPAWMTQKTMAKVRVEAEQKHGFFHRLFLPLHVKLPIQAVAVLFLAATVFYIYRNIQPTPDLSEAPIQEFTAEKEAPPSVITKDKLGKADDSSLRSKKVPQSPEHKALDMKLEYEKPSPPVPQEQAAASAPAPAKPAEQPMTERRAEPLKKDVVAPEAAPAHGKSAEGLMLTRESDESKKRATTPQAVAPFSTRNDAGPGLGISEPTDTGKKPTSKVDKEKNILHIKSYVEFIRTISSFPYEAPRSKKDRIINNYQKLLIGMTTKEVTATIGEPDYSMDTQVLDPPFKQQGIYWTYTIYLKNPKLVDMETDQYLNIFFDSSERAYWIAPSNIQGLTQKGGKLNMPK
jgi:predicted integral membrane protein DUF2275/putative zinc finger protein